MVRKGKELNLQEELSILQFWAYGKDLSRRLGPEKLRAVKGLDTAIKAVSCLPAAIGWDDDEPRVKSRRASPTVRERKR
jgi:hypothetical protein